MAIGQIKITVSPKYHFSISSFRTFINIPVCKSCVDYAHCMSSSKHVTAASPRQGRARRFQEHANQNGLGVSGRIERRSKSFRTGVSGETAFADSTHTWLEQQTAFIRSSWFSCPFFQTTSCAYARGPGSRRAIGCNLRSSRQVRVLGLQEPVFTRHRTLWRRRTSWSTICRPSWASPRRRLQHHRIVFQRRQRKP